MTNLKTQIPSRRKIQLKCPETSITDQESAREFSMTAIKNKLEKGLPITSTTDLYYDLKPLQYTNLQDALDFQQRVSRQFESLPSSLRKEMGNDLRNFEDYINNPENKDSLIKHGLMVKRDATNSDVVDALKDLKGSVNFDTGEIAPDVSNKIPPRARK